MIASLFSKTRPINYAFIFIMLFFCFFLYQIQVPNESFNTNTLFSKFGVLLLVFFSFFLVNFISLKNALTQNDNYAILLYLVFILLFQVELFKFYFSKNSNKMKKEMRIVFHIQKSAIKKGVI